MCICRGLLLVQLLCIGDYPCALAALDSTVQFGQDRLSDVLESQTVRMRARNHMPHRTSCQEEIVPFLAGWYEAVASSKLVNPEK